MKDFNYYVPINSFWPKEKEKYWETMRLKRKEFFHDARKFLGYENLSAEKIQLLESKAMEGMNGNYRDLFNRLKDFVELMNIFSKET